MQSEMTRSVVPSLLFLLIVAVLTISGCATPEPPPQDISGSAGAASQVSSFKEYRLGTGDVISIRVYGGEEEVRLDRVRLDHSGKVSLPFGQFHAKDQTTQELEGAITQSVQGRLLRNPRVWVNIEEYRPFFVEGQVGRPGAYPYQPGLNVRKAVTIAGGLRERAALNKIFVFRDRDGTTVRLKVDLNAPIAPGDTVIVEESFF
jgi:polysaccharide export outer membrane protein